MKDECQPRDSRAWSAAIVDQHRREVLDHFGSCPECGYAAHAFLVATVYADGKTSITSEGVCGLPCGWSGPIEITKMTAFGSAP
ncbi:hypothetical protein NONO_c36420 [Nocardia nova SH22a]|uniref:Uncharacterized protein n=1 Tax=Nocardia nova SH22a TaxID=1415166 RepID=W5TH07_9NOCA|nr:hypothetical protein NONO_c36420 [Nocardia nova SH22a]